MACFDIFLNSSACIVQTIQTNYFQDKYENQSRQKVRLAISGE